MMPPARYAAHSSTLDALPRFRPVRRLRHRIEMGDRIYQLDRATIEAIAQRMPTTSQQANRRTL